MSPEVSHVPADSSVETGKYSRRDISLKDADSGSRLLVPIAVVLTFVGVINALQSFYIFYGGMHSPLNFVRFLVSNLFYCWYFILPALAVKWLSGRIRPRRGSLLPWIAMNLGMIILLTVVHQTLSLGVDRLVLGSRQSETVFSVLFNNPGVWGDFVVYILFLLGFYVIEYRKRGQANELKYGDLEIELARAKLHELRGRIHPSFLFGMLDEIADLVRLNRDREANKVLSLLSDFLRATVYGAESEEVRLQEELAFLSKYIAMEKIRLRQRLEIHRNIDEDAKEALVPNFILHPVVEELLPKSPGSTEGSCEIHVAARREGVSLEMTVTARGNSDRPGAGDGKTGQNVLEITRQRLSQLYHDDYELISEIITRGDDIVRIKIPYRSDSEQLLISRKESI